MSSFGIVALLGAAVVAQASQFYQPLVAGARWNYACTGGITATRSLALGAINSQPGYLNTLTLTIPGQPQVQWSELDLNGPEGMRLGGFAFPPTYPSAQINPPQVEIPNNPVFNQNVSFPDGFGGTLTVTYTGLGTLSVPAGTFTGVAIFKETDNGGPPLPFPRTRYMAKGVGEVQMDLSAVAAQNLPAVTCQLVSYSL